MNIKELILNPDRFFRDLSNKEPSLTTPFIIIFILSVLDAIYTCVYFYYFFLTSAGFDLCSSDILVILTVSLIFIILVAFLSISIGWLLAAGIMYLISKLFKGKGSFKRTMEFTGYGYFPTIIGVLISILVSYYFFSNNQVLTPEVADKIYTFITPIGIVTTLWTLGLWTYGIKYAMNLDLKKAFVVALLLVVLLFIIYMLIFIVYILIQSLF
ncbi:Yip1 family protein [Methanofervidicoccus abyssi]|uniref:Yip1 domain-containing protein n=1 Tax=Methanofervidicoccus abyssi TaxID=2082189 RepID=A0A401HP18_9EURY|nr:Yip1 family protein [Methanofervidicoccus abyssi]GBF35996.1 hypothetical protein MHHB_P0221 [Methanofervidicoccus abyssi]